MGAGKRAAILATAGLTWGCLGSGDEAPLQVGFTTASSEAAEGATAALEVELTSSIGPLEEALPVLVRLGGGTAGGADHGLGSEVTVTFPIGADTGDRLPVDVPLAADGVIEGASEVLQLELEVPEGAPVGFGVRRHELDIVDGDQGLLRLVAGSTWMEGGVGTVEVELDLQPGQTLAVDLDASVGDAGTGTAVAGVDYTAFGTQTVTFEAGAADGARRAIALQALTDVEVESDETVVVELLSTSEGGLIQTSTVAITLQDNDVSGEAFLLVEGGLTGLLPGQITNGDAFDLGAATVGGASPVLLELEFENAGGQPLTLQPLTVTGHVEDFAVELVPVAETLTQELPVLGEFPLAVAADDAQFGAEMSLEPLALAALEGATHASLFDVPLPGGTQVSLQLERVELPFAPTAFVEVDGERRAPGEVLGDLSVWKGTALNMPGSEALLAFSSEGCHGWLRLGGDWGTLNLVTEHASGAPVVHWVWETQLEANLDTPLTPTCAGALELPGAAQQGFSEPAPDLAETTVGFGPSVCRLAIETDYQLFQKFGTASGVTQYVTQLIAAVSDVYERDVQVRLEITYLGVHTSSNDGWTSQDAPGADAGDLLTEFEAAWRPGMPAPADLGHFISGASLGGGVAYVGALCSSFYGFGVSGSIDGNINWGTFTGQPSVSSWDFVVVAHELGHNFGSPHTHSYCPPVDQCTTNCTGPTGCERGTIMSYCHLCGGMANLNLEFHPTVAQRMRETVDGSCLANATLAPGAELSLRVRFEPHSTAGARSADLELRHSALNEASPFVVGTTGSAGN